ncbi:MAG: hypothetical protein HBSAPP03_19560 [Phycisphaerae bacterium]|nr:MAG: hypothetical protein HBSAPP03_19560 [Phycisphaerae bacterium]
MPAQANPLAPLLLRFALGVTFIWAGMGKIAADMSVSGSKAARLANWGVLSATGPSGSVVPHDSTSSPQGRPTPREPSDTPGGGRSDGDRAGVVRFASFEHAIVAVAQPVNTYTAADFPTEVKAKRVYGVALLLHAAGNPKLNDAGKTPMALLPAFAVKDKLPVYLAWAVAIAELAGGGLLLVGLLTRLAAFGIAGTMLGAIWLGEVGPAIQAGTTILGFIPEHPGGYDVALAPTGYVTLLWQIALLAMALAVLLLGPGALSLDGAMGKPKAPPPRPPAPKPAPPGGV